jgi:hypothetical protein
VVEEVVDVSTGWLAFCSATCCAFVLNSGAAFSVSAVSVVVSQKVRDVTVPLWLIVLQDQLRIVGLVS